MEKGVTIPVDDVLAACRCRVLEPDGPTCAMWSQEHAGAGTACRQIERGGRLDLPERMTVRYAILVEEHLPAVTFQVVSLNDKLTWLVGGYLDTDIITLRLDEERSRGCRCGDRCRDH